MTEKLIDALLDVKQRLMRNEYQNEEHVRFSLVGRLLLSLGWNIWNPHEVCTEHQPLTGENFSKVDISLNVKGEDEKAVYIECKGVGKLKRHLEKVEEQMLNYNKRNGASVIILTDGRFWYLYNGTGVGTLRERQFAEHDLLHDDLVHVAYVWAAVVGRAALAEGPAVGTIEHLLKMRRRYFKMAALEVQVKRNGRKSPPQTLSNDLLQLMHQAKFLSATPEETKQFLAGGRYDLPCQVAAIARMEAVRLKSLLGKKTQQVQKPAARQIAVKSLQQAGSTATELPQDSLSTGAEVVSIAKNNPSFDRFILTGRGATATGYLLANGRMRVLAGSTAAGNVTKAFNKKDSRSALMADQVVVRRKGVLLFTCAHTFESPLVAAHVICGNPVAPLTNWRHEITNQTLGEYKQTGQLKKKR